ncbi:T9SS type A sorting domain-containing protein [Flavobacterium sp. N1994]|uniref:T9SS type A sorting domain-containing protein n=1 Tax=Flavobacterium sp. N1994 TaxID=2986827 RepID=UPI002223A5E2|nr:T9SS type A sorting domain-containing protein [Flavobacterium sp. N1994]
MKKIILIASILFSAIISNAQVVSTFAGSGVAGSTNGTGTAAQFNNPTAVCVDPSGNIYVAEWNGNVIRKITAAGIVTTFAGSGSAAYSDGSGTAASFNGPTGVCSDASGNIYVADRGNNRIRKITPAGVVSTLAGSISGSVDGLGTTAQFNFPHGVCIDATGNVFVTDNGNHRIRKISPAGLVTTLAGSIAGYSDGIGTAAKFYSPLGICVDASGNVFVVDNGSNKIRKITPSGTVSTIAGYAGGYVDGAGAIAQFNYPTGICIDATGSLYVTDNSNNKVRKITPAGVVSTVVGSSAGYIDGAGTIAQFKSPNGICITNSGILYIADSGNNRIRKITLCSASNISIVNIIPSTTAAVCTGQSVTLSASAGTNFLWNGGQNTNSITINPTQSTQYSVTVTNSVGCTSTASLSVSVIPNQNVIISGPNALCNGQNVTLTASGVSSYSWNNGSNSSSITVNPINTTTYTVTGTDSCGFISTSSRTVNVINTTPTIAIQQPTCNNLLGGLQVTSPLSSISSIPNTPSDLYISEVTDAAASALTYIEIFNGTGASVNLSSYKLKAYYNGNSTPAWNYPLSGNLANNSVFVVAIGSSMNIGGIVPNLFLSGTGGVNTNDNIRLTTSSDVEVDLWGETSGFDFTPSGQPGYVYKRLPTATVPSVTWNPADWTAIDPEDYSDVGTFGPFMLYEYSVDNGSWQSSTQFNNLAPGTHTISVRETTYLGCSGATTTSFFTIDNPIPQVSIIGSNFVCSGSNTTLTASGGSSYLWSNGSTSDTITVNPSVTTTYSVTATSSYGCTAIASKTITVTSLPTGTITYSGNPFCKSLTSVQVTAVGNVAYAGGTYSSTAGLSIDSVTGSINPSLSTAGAYTITYTIQPSGGCPAISTSTSIVILTTPTASISADGIIATNATITSGSAIPLQLYGTFNTVPNIQWTPATAISSATVANPVVYPSATTTYTASFVNSNGCTQTTSFIVNVTPQPNIGNLSLTSSNTTIGLFDTITVDVQLTGATNLYSLYMKLKGNAAVNQYLDYQGFTASTLLGSGGNVISTPPTATNGVLDFGITKVGPSSGYSGSGLYYTLRFVTKNITIPDGTVFCFYIDDVSAYNSSGTSCGLNNQGQNCYTFSNQIAVWPGDLNNSHTVSTADLLPIGYFYNAIGTARPNATIQWNAQPATLWGYNHSTPNGDAFKVFADSNGDGVINNADQAAIGYNMNQFHSKMSSTNPVFSSLTQNTTAAGNIIVTPSSTTINAAILPQTVTFNVSINNTGGLNNLFGISTNLIFDESVFNLSTAVIDYTGSIFGNTGSDCLVLNYASASMLSIGMTRYANAAINGQGLLFKVTLQTKSSLPALTQTQVNAMVEAANNQTGDALTIQDANTTNLTIINNLGASDIEAVGCKLYPNPVKDKLNIESATTIKLTTIYNTLGQLINSIPQNANQITIDLSNLPANNYFIKIESDDKKEVFKFIKE